MRSTQVLLLLDITRLLIDDGEGQRQSNDDDNDLFIRVLLLSILCTSLVALTVIIRYLFNNKKKHDNICRNIKQVLKRIRYNIKRVMMRMSRRRSRSRSRPRHGYTSNRWKKGTMELYRITPINTSSIVQEGRIGHSNGHEYNDNMELTTTTPPRRTTTRLGIDPLCESRARLAVIADIRREEEENRRRR